MGNIYYLNLSFSVLLGLYVNTNLGGTSIRCFVDGLIEMRSAFFFTSKEPKPCIAIAFPSSSSCVMSDNKELISSEVSLIVYPQSVCQFRCKFLIIHTCLISLHINQNRPHRLLLPDRIVRLQVLLWKH